MESYIICSRCGRIHGIYTYTLCCCGKHINNLSKKGKDGSGQTSKNRNKKVSK